MVNSTLVTTVYVNPATGNDNYTGSRLKPYKTISRALATKKAPMIIQLASDIYNTANGEMFPLIIPSGVILVGNEATKGKNIAIAGSGNYDSEIFGRQTVTLLLLGNAELIGVTITNNNVKGSGIWIESTNPTLTDNTFIQCGREAVFVCGNAKPVITDNLFVKNANAGLVLTSYGKGEVLRNVLENNPLGIVMSDFAAPLVAENKLSANKIGIVVSRNSRPVLRHNLITNSSQGGLFVNGTAIPDLGSSQDSAGNIFVQNQDFDIQNATSNRLLSAGNQFNQALIKGLVETVAVTVSSTNQNPINASFSDIGGHWTKDFVEALVSKGLVSGFPDGTFRPEAPLTRAQYAAAIAKTFQLPATNPDRNFTDIKPEFWAAKAIAKATSMGFISGYPDGSFRPGQNLTKIQAIVSLVSGLQLSGGNTNVLFTYSDRAQIPSYATNAVAIATQKMLIANYPDTAQLEPLRDIKRGELATLIYQALVADGQQQPIISPYIVKPEQVEIPSFKDLVGHWAEPFIRALVSMNLTRGFADGTYQPDKPMNRAQYAALIAVAFNPTPKQKVPDFTDVPKPFWAYSAIQTAAQGGFVGGFRDRTFRPQDYVQRLQVIVSLVNGLELPSAHPDVLLGYTDRDQIPAYAQTAVATATVQKIIVNFPEPKLLQPSQIATRAEVASMVYQALVATGRSRVIHSPYIVSAFAVD
ncbi:S-layer homology domain-containing protein [Calothrix rhizosoleniae]|uniref:S-layer homology domain-containing protein n=1 Tax=Calothrix rhizosoleniae TaxID=888997 RepID=UPI000B49D610|nr:S-layer homology domain-containing protein [Calothrix rhizosoleniae]